MNKEELYIDEEKRQIVWMPSIDKVKKDELTWNMIQNNTIEGFIEFEYYCIDDKMCLCYPYQNSQSLYEYLSKKKANYSFYQMLFDNIVKIMESGASFLLPMQGYLLDPQMIFMDHLNKKVRLCYLPGRKAKIDQEMVRLVELLLEKADHHSEGGVRFIYGLYDMLVTEGFCVERIRQYLEEFTIENSREEKQDTAKKESDDMPKDTKPKEYARDNKMYHEKETVGVDQQQKECKRSGIEYHNLNEKNKKQELYSSKDIQFQLKYVPSYKRNKKSSFPLFKKVKKKSLVDFFISACRLDRFESRLDEICIGRDPKCDCSIAWERISMQHAHIGLEKGQFYVMDMDSAYGTYINGQKISAFVKTICNTGDILTFADISYQICRS